LRSTNDDGPVQSTVNRALTPPRLAVNTSLSAAAAGIAPIAADTGTTVATTAAAMASRLHTDPVLGMATTFLLLAKREHSISIS
jgi:hypothetical protein